MKLATQNKVHVRWMIRRDMPEVLAIERAGFVHAWDEDDFVRQLRQRNTIGMIAERDERVVGFMVYELHKTKLRLLNLAVGVHGKGIGRQLIDKLKRKLHPERRRFIETEVGETNMDACLFFKALGFGAVEIVRGFYEPHSSEDAYRFLYECGGSA